MFADAIEKVGAFTRPVKIITRKYKEETVVPGLATLFFVNDDGWAVTCKHVAAEIISAGKISQKYQEFKEAQARIPAGKGRSAAVKKLELVQGYKAGSVIQEKVQFPGSVSKFKECDITLHPDFDLAILHFKGYEKILYSGHAVFVKDMKSVRPGDFLCRIGFPFPEYSDFRYDEGMDDIEWDGSAGSSNTPRFPIEGMFTRQLADKNGKIYGLELSTPGLRGQSGGPLFNAQGLVCGMQSATKHLHLGFDMIDEKMVIGGRQKVVNNQPFLHVGHCIGADVIKDFLKEKGVEYFEA